MRLPTSIGQPSAGYLALPAPTQNGSSPILRTLSLSDGEKIYPLPDRMSFGPTLAQKSHANGNRVKSMRVQPSDANLLRNISRKMVRMFDAALTTNLNADFPISLTSSNAEILTSLIGVRSRARTLERNNGYGSAMVWDWMRNIGGHDPFRLEMQVGETVDGKFTSEPDTNRIIMNAWEEYGRPENCTVRRNIGRKEMYWTAIASMCRCGGAIFRHRGALNDRFYSGNPIGYAIEPLEIDRLDQNWQRPKSKANANEIQFGIEFDDYRAPLAYWILGRHPGDIISPPNVGKYRERVPAQDVIALFDIQTRPEQMVGMSRMASVIQLLHRLDQFDVAHITAALTACCKTIWIEKQFPTAPEFVPDHIKQEIAGSFGENGDGADGGYGGNGWGGGEGQRMANMSPGEINELPWGNKPVLLDPHFPIEAAPQFKRDLLRAVAAGGTVWYNQLAQDMESVNFASGRLGEGAARDMAMMSQEHVIDMLVRPHFETWLKYWLMSKESSLPYSRYEEFCKAAVFNGRRWAYTNPLQDVQADILTVEAGMDSRSHIISESPRGGNAEEVNREIQADRESDKLHNLDFSAADVTKPTIQKGLPGEDVANPLDSKEGPANKKPGSAQSDGASKSKGKSDGIDLDRMERDLEVLAKSDPDFVESGEYDQSKKFIDMMRKIRDGKRRKKL